LATYKINIATCRGLDKPAAIVQAMEEYGLADKQEMGVLHASVAGNAAFGTLVRRTNLTVQRLDAKTRQVVSDQVEKVSLIPFGAFPQAEQLEVYAGTAATIKEVEAFFGGALTMAVAVDPIELDVISSVQKLMKTVQKFQLRAVRVSDYAASSYMIGPYAPKFMDTEHGLKFLEQYTEAVKTVQVRFAAPAGRATATLTPNASFSFSCHEDDQPHVQDILRKLVGR
jgi:hypothetical protein